MDPREHKRESEILLTPLPDNPSTGSGHPLPALRSARISGMSSFWSHEKRGPDKGWHPADCKQDILCLHFDLHAFQGCHPFEVTRREVPTKDDIPQTANRTPQECCHTEKIVAIWMKLYNPASSGASIRTGIGNLPYRDFLLPVLLLVPVARLPERVKLFFDWFRFENELIVDPREHRRERVTSR